MSFLALHRACFRVGGGVIFDIESTVGTGIPFLDSVEYPFLTAAEKERDAEKLASGGIPPMCLRDEGELFERFQLREDTDYFIDVTVPLAHAEAEAKSSIHSAWPFNQRLAKTFKRDPPRRWKIIEKDGRSCTVITGQLRLRSHAGVISFDTEFAPGPRAEVACRKLGYFEEFKALLNDLAEKAAELLLAFDSPTSISFESADSSVTNDAALHFLMRFVMSPGNLPLAMEELLAAPHSRLVEYQTLSRIEDIFDIDLDLLVDGLDTSVLAVGGPLSRLFLGFTPSELPSRELYDSVNTPENRYTKALLEHCAFVAQGLERRMAVRGKRAAQREAMAWSNELNELLQHGIWREVGPQTNLPSNSQTLLRKRGYKELFRFDAALRASLSLAWKQGVELSSGLVGDIRPVSQIYEYWCFFALRDVLKELCIEISGGNFLSVSKDRLSVRLSKGRVSECQFEFAALSGKKLLISLFCNKRFRRAKSSREDWEGSYTASFDPDLSIRVRTEKSGQSVHWLHFDAKYRLDRREADGLFRSDDNSDEEDMDEVDGEEEAEESYDAELKRVHKQDDLFKMHTYRDGIFGTRGAYILFPGDGVGGKVENPSPNLFVRHPRALGTRTGNPIPSVGAFPLTPEKSGSQAHAVRELLRTAFEAIAEGPKYLEEEAFFPPCS